MPTGSSHLYYPNQDNSGSLLAFDDSYFLIKLHDAQAYFSANLLQQPGVLLVSSSVESSFSQSSPTKSLHRLISLRKNTPHLLGINTNLTKWLPSIEADSLHMNFECKVLHGTPIKSLVDKMDSLQLESVLSLLRPDMAVAASVAKIVGSLLSFFAQEGKETIVFSLDMDINLSGLQVGYNAVLGSHTDEPYPNTLEIKHGQLSKLGGRELSHYSYVVIEARTIPRLNPEIARRQVWGELLYECRDTVLNATIKNKGDRSEALQRWFFGLEQVRSLARKDRSFLGCEVSALIAEAQLAVDQKLQTNQEVYGIDEIPSEWQPVLGFSTFQQLRESVRDYQDAVVLSEKLLREYAQLDSFIVK